MKDAVSIGEKRNCFRPLFEEVRCIPDYFWFALGDQYHRQVSWTNQLKYNCCLQYRLFPTHIHFRLSWTVSLSCFFEYVCKRKIQRIDTFVLVVSILIIWSFLCRLFQGRHYHHYWCKKQKQQKMMLLTRERSGMIQDFWIKILSISKTKPA